MIPESGVLLATDPIAMLNPPTMRTLTRAEPVGQWGKNHKEGAKTGRTDVTEHGHRAPSSSSGGAGVWGGKQNVRISAAAWLRKSSAKSKNLGWKTNSTYSVL